MSIEQKTSHIQGPLIIGVSGQARHGKDTIADYLVKTYGFQKFLIAEPIKEICRTIFSFNQEQLYGDLKETFDPRWNVRPRECLQFIGTELFRQQIKQLLPEIGSKIWIKSLCEKLRGVISSDPAILIVISDLRFEDECSELQKFSQEIKVPFYSIRVENPRVPVTPKEARHASEMINWTANYLVNNTGTLEELYHKVEMTLQEIDLADL